MLLIEEAYTVINPRTMMIHSSNASFTDRAMMRLRRFNRVTLLAFLVKNSIKKFHILLVY